MAEPQPFTQPHELPGPYGPPLIGHLLQISSEQSHLTLERWAERYGSLFQIRLGRSRLVVVSDHKVIQRILEQRPQSFRRNCVIEDRFSEIGINGLFTAEGEDWRRQRRTVVAALSRTRLASFFPRLKATTARLQRRWEGAADGNQLVDVCRDLTRFTVDVTMQLAFGVDPNTLETPGPVIQRHLEKIGPGLQRRFFTLFPYWRLIRLPPDRALDRAVKALDREVEVIIRATREHMAAHPGHGPTNFLEAMLMIAEHEGSNLTSADLLAHTSQLLLAGEDTTAYTMSWIVHYFTRFPEAFARIRREVDDLIAPAAALDKLEQANHLPFLDAFCNEVMRLKPVAPHMALETLEDTEILGCLMPKGTKLFVLLRYAATREEHFAGGDCFDPERWLPQPAGHGNQPHNTQAFVPFGAGPRICPGQHLAMLEIRAVLAMLCRNFDLRPVSHGKEVKEKMAVVMRPDHLHLRLKRRSLASSVPTCAPTAMAASRSGASHDL
ncbi:cytochrome P450 [Candidatus Synechococcus spongiarum]|uniref:cytochrome P450 n=1 Tax=Candidatus Synechococcus spongiarum TaxID=431041 RepID=UPI0015D675C3|nr:cytochrome P450 [Candidatus Synechococcus spongiarum]